MKKTHRGLILRACVEIQHFSSSVEKYFISERVII